MILVGGGGEDEGRHRAWDAEMDKSSEHFDTVWLGREDPLILHYTSGSTGKPKGALHVQNAMIGHFQTGRWILDLKPTETYWCTADPGWVTGTSYGIFAPWLNGATNVIRGGRFDADAWYETIQKHRVTVWYSAPTAFRMLMAAGEKVAEKYDLSSLRHVLSVGEPLNPEVVRWGWRVYGKRIHDNWWMTETGHQLISNYPSMDIRPGSMGRPIPGVEAAILDEKGEKLPPNTLGLLCIKAGWPGMMRQIWNNPARYQEYFRFPGYYFTGDTAYYDEDSPPLVRAAPTTRDQHCRERAARSRGIRAGLPPAVPRRGHPQRRAARPDHQGVHLAPFRPHAQRGSQEGDRRPREEEPGRPRRAARDRVPRQAPQDAQRKDHAPRAQGLGPGAPGRGHQHARGLAEPGCARADATGTGRKP